MSCSVVDEAAGPAESFVLVDEGAARRMYWRSDPGTAAQRLLPPLPPPMPKPASGASHLVVVPNSTAPTLPTASRHTMAVDPAGDPVDYAP